MNWDIYEVITKKGYKIKEALMGNSVKSCRKIKENEYSTKFRIRILPGLCLCCEMDKKQTESVCREYHQ